MQKPPDRWIRCKKCGHKLLKIVDEGGVHIETKCHSCKAINEIKIIGGNDNERTQ